MKNLSFIIKKPKNSKKNFSMLKNRGVNYWRKLLKLNQLIIPLVKLLKRLMNRNEMQLVMNNDENLLIKLKLRNVKLNQQKTKYGQMINEAGEQRPRYVAAMKEVFERTQAFEKKRLEFFKETFEEYAKLLEAATNTK